MKLLYALLAASLLSITLPCAARAEFDWVVDILPGTAAGNFAADEFSVTGPNGKETVSLFSTFPNASFGIAINMVDGFFDLKGGGGLLMNGKLHSMMYGGQAALYLEMKPGVLMGPHASFNSFAAPEWWGDTDITFSKSTGYMLGFHVAAGDRVAYLFSIDYLSLKFDVESMGADVTASESSLDLSGLAVQFGVRVQF